MAVGFLILGTWSLFEPSTLIVAEERIAVESRLRGPLRVAVLTDLHVGSPFNGIDKLRQIVDRTNAARPDVICILGDLVIQGVVGGRFVVPEEIGRELQRLRAPAGVFAVLGNHDAWFDYARVRTALERNGIRVVEQTAVRVEASAGSFWVTGVSDVWTGKPDIAAALAAVSDADAPVLLLTHNPDIFPVVPGRVALTLAGHTHGGQVRLPLIGRPIVPSRYGRRYAAGHVIEGGRHLFVSTGTGTSILPIRFRVAPAIAVLTVVSDGRPNLQ